MSFREMSIEQFSEALASKDPTPGGGCASALAAVMATGLTAMVARTTAAWT
jgi:formiminotetrahydrofolate cyclodeaminase